MNIDEQQKGLLASPIFIPDLVIIDEHNLIRVPGKFKLLLEQQPVPHHRRKNEKTRHYHQDSVNLVITVGIGRSKQMKRLPLSLIAHWWKL